MVGGEVLWEARGDLGEGEGEGVGDLEVRPRLEHRGDNMAARNEGEMDLGLSRELDMAMSMCYHTTVWHNTCPCQSSNSCGDL